MKKVGGAFTMIQWFPVSKMHNCSVHSGGKQTCLSMYHSWSVTSKRKLLLHALLEYGFSCEQGLPDGMWSMGGSQEGCLRICIIVVPALVWEGALWDYSDWWTRALKGCVKERRKGSGLDGACPMWYGTFMKVLGGVRVILLYIAWFECFHLSMISPNHT